MLKYLKLTDGLGDKLLIPISNYGAPHFETISTGSTHLTGEPYNCKTLVRVPLGVDEVMTYTVRESVDIISTAIDVMLATRFHNPAL